MASKRSRQEAGLPNDPIIRAKMTAEALRTRGQLGYEKSWTATTTMKQAYEDAMRHQVEEASERIRAAAAARAAAEAVVSAAVASAADASIPYPQALTIPEYEKDMLHQLSERKLFMSVWGPVSSAIDYSRADELPDEPNDLHIAILEMVTFYAARSNMLQYSLEDIVTKVLPAFVAIVTIFEQPDFILAQHNAVV